MGWRDDRMWRVSRQFYKAVGQTAILHSTIGQANSPKGCSLWEKRETDQSPFDSLVLKHQK
ncbi:hypothetical protein BMS3Bbin04_00955 [bacterium BMS3Bbin04]|nr:hypothetical protein BMS3Bbin04_00955 [bacterium BMS3Bbin04]